MSFLRQAAIVLFILIVLVAVWELSAVLFPEQTKILPPPHEVARAFVDAFEEGKLISDSAASLKRIGVGFLLAAVVGIIVGLTMASVSAFSSTMGPIIELFRPIPPIAWIPIAVLWFGIGDKPAYFIVLLGAFFPIFTNAYMGFKSVDSIHIRAARALGASPLMIVRTVVLPSALPFIITGLRIGLGTAWICVITAELVGAQSGLGYMIQLNRLMLQTDRVIVGMIVIALIGFLMNECARLVERAITPWRRHAE